MKRVSNEWNFEKREKNQQKRLLYFRVILSTTLGLLGLLIISSQLIPLTNSLLQGKLLESQDQNIAKPLPDSYKQYIQGEFAYYAPGQNYFLDLTRQAQNQPVKGSNVIINSDYDKDMWIYIDSVNMERIKITSNVASSDESVYNRYLKDGVAHFKGTPLPGDGGNSFIYGHSAISSFFRSHPDLPETIFTRLENVDIGDEVKIERDGEILSYTIRRKHIANAEDFSVLDPSSHKETVTLMTCWPIGIGSKRLILIAESNES
jgi:LPXTG-site transpeptidase (sortase) family protein